jgi:hypothetical protein
MPDWKLNAQATFTDVSCMRSLAAWFLRECKAVGRMALGVLSFA